MLIAWLSLKVIVTSTISFSNNYFDLKEVLSITINLSKSIAITCYFLWLEQSFAAVEHDLLTGVCIQDVRLCRICIAQNGGTSKPVLQAAERLLNLSGLCLPKVGVD